MSVIKILNNEIINCTQCSYIEWESADNKPAACRDGYYCNNPDAPVNCFIISSEDLRTQQTKTGFYGVSIPNWCPLEDKK